MKHSQLKLSLFVTKESNIANRFLLCQNIKAVQRRVNQGFFRNIGIWERKFGILLNKLIINNYKTKMGINGEIHMSRLMQIIAYKYDASVIKFILDNFFNYELWCEFTHIKQPIAYCQLIAIDKQGQRKNVRKM